MPSGNIRFKDMANRSFFLICFVVIVLVMPCAVWGDAPLWKTSVSTKGSSKKKFSEDQIIVKYKQGRSFVNLSRKPGKSKVKKEKEFKQLGISVLKKLNKNKRVKEVIKELYETGEIEYAEPDYVIEINLTPNDPQFGQLWGLHNTGQGGGTVGADIDASDAWDINTGNSDFVVGVIDTGVDYNHEDLAANRWTNPGEVAGNGIDDDGNGYVDDVYGIDAYNNDSDPFDDHGHGTHCAGTIGAVGNNGKGVVGVNWNVKIMALKFLSSGGSGYTSDAIECLNYAVMMRNTYGVDIRLTSNSWGGGGYSQALGDAIEASKNAGMLFMAAAGNSSSDNDSSPHYPSSYDNENVIAVASTDRNDNLSSFSSYGATSVDLGAPGSSILSTTPGNNYSFYSGTSMATPHVAGAAALIWARYPSYTFGVVKNLIMNTVDSLSSLSGKVVSGGRLNVYNALSCSPGNPSMAVISPASGFAASVDQDTTVVVRVTDCGSPVTNATVTVSLTNGDSSFNLFDNGTSPDTTANDGKYSGTWTPSRTGAVTLNIEASGFGDTLTGSVSGNVIENYTYNDQVTYNWIDASTGTRISPFYDDDYESIAIGFDFVFYDNTYSTVKISSNGYLTFGTDGTDYTNDAIPFTTDPDNFIAPFWDDLNPYTAGSVYYLPQGSAPNRTVTIEWENISHYYNTGTATFEVTLYERSNNIIFQYKDVDFGTSSYNGGTSATIGIENADGSVGVEYSYNEASVTQDTAILFSVGPNEPTVTTGSATSLSSTSATLNGTVNPNRASTTVTFEYGTTTNYGSTATATQSPLTGTTAQSVSAGLTGLTPGTTYHFRVKATNSAGTTYGSDGIFTTSAAAPTATTGSATSIASGSATLNGTVNPNGASTTVTFEYGITVSYGSTVTATQSPVTGTSDQVVSAGITGLTPGTTYHFRVKATNSAGTTYGNDQIFTTSAPPVTAPTVTTGSATSVSTSSATLNGTVNPNGATTTVVFEYGTTTTYGSMVAAEQISVTGASSQDINAGVSELKVGTTYHFRVKATNSAGTSYGADKSFTTTAAGVVYVEPNGLCGENTPCYPTIQEGINAADEAVTIKIAQGTYSEGFALNQSIDLTLQGGWDSTFTTQTSGTIIRPPTITSGSITFQNLIIRP